jgi:hypothetical protein
MEPTEEQTRVISGALKWMRRPRFGLLELGILIAIVVVFLAACFTFYTVIGQQRDIARTSRNTNQISRDLADLLFTVKQAIDAGPAATDRLLERFAEELSRQIAVHDQRVNAAIVRETERRETTRTVIVVVSPQPYPTSEPTPCPNAVVVVDGCRRPR